MSRELGGSRPKVGVMIGTGEVGAHNGGGAVGSGSGPMPLGGRVVWSRRIYLALALGFAACVAVQVFFAGMGVFVDAARWSWHSSFIHVFEFLPLLMLPLAFSARLSAAVRWLTALLLALIALQYITANMGTPLAALHPVNGMLIFWVATIIAGRAWRATVAR